jgi:hypothetical protein
VFSIKTGEACSEAFVEVLDEAWFRIKDPIWLAVELETLVFR